MDRRDFLLGSMGAAIFATDALRDAFAQNAAPRSPGSWDHERVRHILPTVSDTRILIKASFL